MRKQMNFVLKGIHIVEVEKAAVKLTQQRKRPVSRVEVIREAVEYFCQAVKVDPKAIKEPSEAA